VRALRFHAARDLRIEEVTEPSAPSAGEVVVRVVTCGICGTDLHEYTAGPIVTADEPHPLTGAQNHRFSAMSSLATLWRSARA
jgi:(R,R)-butanediol dehydrogenase / meso-butanediol dehydrogenase / diacetyl reductase